MYKFSIPMPCKKEFIDKAIEINRKIEKSQITDFYLGLPGNCDLFCGFKQKRNEFLHGGETFSY